MRELVSVPLCCVTCAGRYSRSVSVSEFHSHLMYFILIERAHIFSLHYLTLTNLVAIPPKPLTLRHIARQRPNQGRRAPVHVLPAAHLIGRRYGHFQDLPRVLDHARHRSVQLAEAAGRAARTGTGILSASFTSFLSLIL
jgi:hypothetical protein